MDTEKIIQDLNRRFAAPLPEFYKRRIIIWHDEEEEFIDKIDESSLLNAKIVTLTDTNNFEVKKLLAVDDTTSNYLIYCPLSYDSLEDNWLLDIELYSESFRSDLVSMWMDEMSVPQTPALRKEFKTFRKFFNAQTRRKIITSQKTIPDTPAKLQMSIMASLAGVKDVNPGQIMKAVLSAGLDIDNNTVYQEFVTYGVNEPFWRMIAQGTGYHEADVNLGRLACHILLTATSRTIRTEFLQGLEEFISGAHQAYCYDFVSEWLHSETSELLRDIAEYVEGETKLPQRFRKLEIDDLKDTEVFPCINEIIIIKLTEEISNHVIDSDKITAIIEKRRTCVFYEEVKNFYEGILQLAYMQDFNKAHAEGFHLVEPKKIWKEYTSDYYIMDTYYRQFHRCYSASLKDYHEVLSNPFASVKDIVEGVYTNWFLGKLGENWSSAVGSNLSENGRILEVPEQTEFYQNNIMYADSKVYVIISDAMRYEVGASLAEQLRRETQAKVDLRSMQAIFPTITKFGMAALLPHKKLSVEVKGTASERLVVLADGQSTESNNRDKVLKDRKANSVALRYKDIIGMKRTERQPLVKGMDVVYIYHDTIDEAGHLESTIFEACDTAINEIKAMVKIITNEFGGAHIIITADHGFLYTDSPLAEDDKLDKSRFADEIVECGRRYAILQKDSKPNYLQQVKFLGGNTDYEGYAPKENIRIKMKGGGLNFVHGGISLQEMVVPVIDYRFLRNQSKEYKKNKNKYDTKPVTIELFSAGRKVSNMIFSLDFYQKEAVGDNREAATYQLYFTDSVGKTISDTATIIADKDSGDARERTFRCSFNLKSLKYDVKETYYLVIADSDGLVIKREEFQIDIAFAVDEFDFFS